MVAGHGPSKTIEFCTKKYVEVRGKRKASFDKLCHRTDVKRSRAYPHTHQNSGQDQFLRKIGPKHRFLLPPQHNLHKRH